MDENSKRKIESEYVEKKLHEFLYRCEKLIRCYEKVKVMDRYLDDPKTSMKGGDNVYTTGCNVYVNNVIAYAEEQEKKYAEYIEHEHFVNTIANILKQLNESEIELLILHIEKNQSMRSIANDRGVNPMNISREFSKIYKKILKMLHNY